MELYYEVYACLEDISACRKEDIEKLIETDRQEQRYQQRLMNKSEKPVKGPAKRKLTWHRIRSRCF